jgi:predicted DNA-binding ribbon-helix-helix protein
MLQKHSIVVNGRSTSIAVEPPFWEALSEIAWQRRISTAELVGQIDMRRGDENLSSAIRVAVVDHLKTALAAVPTPEPATPRRRTRAVRRATFKAAGTAISTVLQTLNMKG